MGKRGPKPAPTVVKLLRGVDKHDPQRINREEPTPPGGPTDPPRYLDGNKDALSFWREHAPILTAMGLLTPADRHGFAALCEAFARYRAEPGNSTRLNEFRRGLTDFGLTPSGRSSLKAAPTKPRDELAEFLTRRPG